MTPPKNGLERPSPLELHDGLVPPMIMKTPRHSVWVVRILATVWLLATSPALLAQGARMQSPYDALGAVDADHPLQRDLWFYRGRILPGQATAALRYRAHLQKMQIRAARTAVLRNLQQVEPDVNVPGSGWTALGPAPLASNATGPSAVQDYGWVSGRATAVVIDSADITGSTVYAGGAYGGVWRSQNATNGGFGNAGGVVWTPLIDNQATLAVGAITLQPGNFTGQLSNVVLVGTGEANSSGDSYYGLGFLRSADAGTTWTLISTASNGTLSLNGLAAARMAFSTKSGQTGTVVAAMATSPVAAEDGLITSATQRGLYTSTDAGSSWIFDPLTDPSGAVSPATSATSVVYNAAAQLFYAAIRYHGFYSSPDGLNWTRLSVQPGGLTTTACPPNYQSATPTCPIYRGEIAVVPGRNEMYAWYVDVFAVDQGIWRSLNGGASWTQIPDTAITNCGDPVGGCGTQQGTYNLEILAVPNGTLATDLYAGAINLYKCTLTNNASTTCSQGSWLNLTHVYGCSAIAKVHPDQHDLDFSIVNGKDIMYFANDGGIYRALDGYLGLSTATCGGTNQFDSLNQTLGSMTQFVSFSQHPTDPNTIVGGTQDNGSPATASATSGTGTPWLNVNGGDGGYNAINPASPGEWFTANTDVSIQRCTSGITCLEGDFFQGTVVLPANLNGDHGAFYTPYILDPQSLVSELIIGTCRVWRAAGTGVGFTALSGDFEPNGIPPCTGSEINLVRSLAAGGPKDSSGFSKVIYAGTDGFGPGTIPAGGHLWVTTNAAGGAPTWMDRTGSINPSGFPISGIAVDTSDATGQTAYATIMGFHVSHVWKTTNAGATWSDFSGAGLPDSPVNAVVIDPGSTSTNGVIYVGTDVGVFSSSTGSASWTEVGPSASGGPGYLPNVSVTGLRIFNSGGSKRLRASTYGRGIWDFNLITTPDFQFGFNSTTQTIFPSQSAIFNGTLTALNGYNSLVALSCSGGKPTTCTLSPSSILPTPSGAIFSLSAAGAIGDYLFNAHGAGSDTNTVTHDQTLTLRVVDFGLTAPVPNAVTVNRPNTSQNITFSVTASGSFSGTVALSCSGLPSGATCNFLPSASVQPTSSSPIAVTLTIATTSGTPPGSSTVSIQANTSGAPAAKTQNLSLTVTALPDYTITINGSSARTTVNQAVQIFGTLTSVNSYVNPVNLSCTGTAPSTCTISPASVTPTVAGAGFTATLNSTTAGTFNFNVTGAGTDSSHITHSAPASLIVTADFSISNTTGSQTVLAGQTATFALNFAPIGSPTFGGTVTYLCTGVPILATCSFNPTSLSGSSGATVVTLSIATAGPNAFHGRTVPPFNSILLPSGLLVLGFLVTGLRGIPPRKGRLVFYSGLIVIFGLIMLACGGSSSSAPPPLVVSVQVTPANAQLFTGQSQQFTATVTGSSNTQVNWNVNGVAGGNSAEGTISGAGLYTAPAALPGTPVTVGAVSQADSTKSGTASVTVLAPTPSGAFPITVTATLGGIQHYTILTLTVQ